MEPNRVSFEGYTELHPPVPTTALFLASIPRTRRHLPGGLPKRHLQQSSGPWLMRATIYGSCTFLAYVGQVRVSGMLLL